MKIRAITVDDEAPARERVARFLSKFDEIDVIGEAGNGKEAVKMIDGKNPDLVFLDIQMPDFDGFEVLRLLKSEPIVIFVTAYDEYAIRAFEINALDYLLKPFSFERFKKAIKRAEEEIKKKERFSSKITNLLSALEKRCLERIAIREGARILVVEVEDIDWIGTEKGPVFIHTKRKKYAVNFTLDGLEKKLDPKLFFRSHRSALLNLNRIKEIIPWFSGRYKIILNSGDEVPLSRDRVRELKKIIKW